MTQDPVVPALYDRVNKRLTVYVFNHHRSRTMFVMGDARRFTLTQARAEARRLSVIVEEGGDPRPYRRREWCDNCDSPWDYVERGKRPTSCPKCRTRPCARCGEPYEVYNLVEAKKRRFCSRACAKETDGLGEFECRQCGAVFQGRYGKNANKYCSRACAFADRDAWNKSNVVGGGGRAPAVERECQTCGERYFRARATTQYHNVYCSEVCATGGLEGRICSICGGRFDTKYVNSLTCSDQCKREVERRKSAVTWGRKKGGRAYTVPTPKRKDCASCGAPFEGRQVRHYCSIACRPSSHRTPSVRLYIASRNHMTRDQVDGLVARFAES